MLAPYEIYLDKTVIPLRLACTTRSGWPFVLSLWYLYQDDALYCATQASAKIVAHLRNDPRCAFEIAADLPPYCGIRGQAEVEILATRGGDVLEQLLRRYLGGVNNPLAAQLLQKRNSEVALRLQPISVFSWNFSARMRNSVGPAAKKICP